MSAWPKRLLLILAWVLIATAPCLAADGTIAIGLRFIVCDDLGHDAHGRNRTETILSQYVSELNDIYRNSKVVLRGEIVDIHFARIETIDALQILQDMEHERDVFASMFRHADEFGADYTIAVVSRLKIRGSSSCGRAFAVNQTIEEISLTRRAFAVVNIHPVCGAQTLAHELGHLMGLNHGALVDFCLPGQGHTSALTPYANGYGWGECDGVRRPGEFGTIMVGGYLRHVTGENRGNLPIFSNPRIHDDRCGHQGVCGDPLIGDAARALNEHAHYYAGHEEPDVHTLRYASEGLRACIGRKYRFVEIVDLEELSCPDRGIDNLRELEQLTALRRIDLSGNLIQDVSVFKKLSPSTIESIDLTGNNQISCHQLESLMNKLPGRIVRPDTCIPY